MALGLAVMLAALAGCKREAARTQTAEEQFAAAQQLQQDEKWAEAIKTYRKIAEEYPESRQGANSQFMVGYIYANQLKDYEQARIELNRFLDKFSAVADSGLIVGARFELQYMGRSIEEVPVLSELGQPDTSGEGGGE